MTQHIVERHDFLGQPFHSLDIVDEHGKTVALVPASNRRFKKTASLFLAAPDLLSALEEAVEALSHVALHGVPYDPDNEQRKRVHQRGLNAIAKAEEGS